MWDGEKSYKRAENMGTVNENVCILPLGADYAITSVSLRRSEEDIYCIARLLLVFGMISIFFPTQILPNLTFVTETFNYCLNGTKRSL